MKYTTLWLLLQVHSEFSSRAMHSLMWPSLIFTGFPQSGEISPLKELVTSSLGCEQGGGRILLRLEFRFVEDWYSPLSSQENI